MKKIKIIGLFIFILSIILAILSSYISNQNKINTNILNTISEQEAYTQEISKNIFYIYKHDNISTKNLDKAIKGFMANLENRDKNLSQIPSILVKNQSQEILKLWNEFYLDVNSFLSQKQSITAYTSILLEKLVNDIYNKNQKLIIKFDQLKKIHQVYFNNILNTYKNIQYILFIILILLLIYLFTQIKVILTFINEFTNRSNKIIKNSSIKDLEPLKEASKNKDISEASNNFNILLDKINNSIDYSTNSIEHTTQSLKQIENNIEEFLELIYIQNKDIDVELTKKEDAIIESLDELMNITSKLDNLKYDINKLVNYQK